MIGDGNASASALVKSGCTFVLHKGENISVGTNKTNAYIVEQACTLEKVLAYIKTPAVGADVIIDINKNGSTIWSTQANRLTITAGQNSSSQTSFNTTTFVEGDLLTIDIDQVGSSTAGQEITVRMRFING